MVIITALCSLASEHRRKFAESKIDIADYQDYVGRGRDKFSDNENGVSSLNSIEMWANEKGVVPIHLVPGRDQLFTAVFSPQFHAANQ